MSIEIKITDLYNESRAELLQLSKFLQDVANRNREKDIPENEISEIPEHTHRSGIPHDIFFPVKKDESTGSDDVDSAGTPWHPQIHSRTRTKRPDGTWKKLRGLDPAIEAKVLRELKGEPAIPQPPLVVPVPRSFMENSSILSSVAVPPPPVEEPEPEVDNLDDLRAENERGYGWITQQITSAIMDHRLTRTDVLEALKKVGLNALPELGARQDVIPALALILGFE